MLGFLDLNSGVPPNFTFYYGPISNHPWKSRDKIKSKSTISFSTLELGLFRIDNFFQLFKNGAYINIAKNQVYIYWGKSGPTSFGWTI